MQNIIRKMGYLIAEILITTGIEKILGRMKYRGTIQNTKDKMKDVNRMIGDYILISESNGLTVSEIAKSKKYKELRKKYNALEKEALRLMKRKAKLEAELSILTGE